MTIATDTPIAIRNIAMNESFIRPTNGNIKFRFFYYSNENVEENVQITRNFMVKYGAFLFKFDTYGMNAIKPTNAHQ